MHNLNGGCHCGNLTLELSTRWTPDQVHPRACDCSFCRKHAAAYISDPQGQLTIRIKDSALLQRYRQGAELAEFVLCKLCGVLVAVCYEEAGRVYAAVNKQAINENEAFAEDKTASPQLLSAEEKVQRWKNAWFSDVSLISGKN